MVDKISNPNFLLLVIILLTTLMHLPIFPKDLNGKHLWRQTETQINTQHFLRTDNNILNPRSNALENKTNIIRLEFPLMQWLIAQVQFVFGEHIIVTRIFLWLISILSIFTVYHIVLLLFCKENIALFSTGAFAFAPLFFYYSFNPHPDNLALCAGLLSIYFYFKFSENNNFWLLFLSAITICIAGLCKLPFLLLGVTMAIHFLFKKDIFKNRFAVMIYYGISLIPVYAWYQWVIPQWGTKDIIVKGFFNKDYPRWNSFHLICYQILHNFTINVANAIVLPFVLIGIFFIIKNKMWKNIKLFSFCISGIVFLFYFIYEIQVIQYAHDYYLMPFIVYMAVFSGIGFVNITEIYFSQKISNAILFLIPIVCGWYCLHLWSTEESCCNATLLNNRKRLQMLVPHSEKCIMLNDPSNYIFSYMIDKQGYCFNNDKLPTEWVIDLVKNKKVKYMYSTSSIVNQQLQNAGLIDSTIFVLNDISVFTLKK
jgi:Dolichyl-phosphate-mannose-protein mannosyltransferase